MWKLILKGQEKKEIWGGGKKGFLCVALAPVLELKGNLNGTEWMRMVWNVSKSVVGWLIILSIWWDFESPWKYTSGSVYEDVSRKAWLSRKTHPECRRHHPIYWESWTILKGECKLSTCFHFPQLLAVDSVTGFFMVLLLQLLYHDGPCLLKFEPI